MNFAPFVAVTLWSTLSSFVQVTFWPTRTVVLSGWNRRPFIETAPGAAAGGEPTAVLDDAFFADPSQPAPTRVRASTASSIGARIRYFTLKLTFALAPAFEWS